MFAVHVVHYTILELVAGACTFVCQLDVIILYYCIFEFVQTNAISTVQLNTAVCCLLFGCELIYLLLCRPPTTCFSSILRDHASTALTIGCFGYGFTPIIRSNLSLNASQNAKNSVFRTLTTSISTDTIYALSILVFLLSLVFHDYGAEVAM